MSITQNLLSNITQIDILESPASYFLCWTNIIDYLCNMLLSASNSLVVFTELASFHWKILPKTVKKIIDKPFEPPPQHNWWNYWIKLFLAEYFVKKLNRSSAYTKRNNLFKDSRNSIRLYIHVFKISNASITYIYDKRGISSSGNQNNIRQSTLFLWCHILVEMKPAVIRRESCVFITQVSSKIALPYENQQQKRWK